MIFAFVIVFGCFYGNQLPTMAAVSLFSLVESGDAQTLQEQIEAGDIDLGSRDSNGRTALDLAVILGQEDITKILTENGEVNLVNTSGGFKACEKKKSGLA